MVSDSAYELCLPILQDEQLEDEDKTDRLEEVLKRETGLAGKPLENAVLDTLWRFRGASTPNSSPPPSRHTLIRRASPAPWQAARAMTPVASSPKPNPPPGFGVAPPSFTRAKSSTASPFTSPRPSPRLAFSSPRVPRSPNLDAYEFSESSPAPEFYGDYGSDTVDWLVNDETGSTTSSSFTGELAFSNAMGDWMQPQSVNMSPYDMLRSILRDDRSDEEIEQVLEANGYDLSATIMALMDGQALEAPQVSEVERTYVVGKSMSPSFRPATPANQSKSNIICKYWLSSGHCARADCRFSHDPSKTVCKYWLMGNCLAGDTCMFLHDNSALMARMMLDRNSTPPTQSTQASLGLQDYDAFPALQANGGRVWHTPFQASLEPSALEQLYGNANAISPPPGLSARLNFTPELSSRSHSRPSSRHQSRPGTPALPAVDDKEAFPSLGAAAKGAKRHHGKRGPHGHLQKDNAGPGTLAELVRACPSPGPVQGRKVNRPSPMHVNSRENSAAAQAIPAPENIPWLQTGEGANKAYLKARQEAFKHGALRNKFLQSAAQAWNRNDSRAAKALSLRGQSENNLMREAHREAARHLYDERNKENGGNGRELFVDLHGLHPEEAVSYLERILLRHQASTRPLYAITGTGHHSKNGKDKVGKAIRGFLNEWRYAFREFSVPGDRGNVGGILGIDPSSWDRKLGERAASEEDRSEADEDREQGKIRILKASEVLRGPKKAGS